MRVDVEIVKVHGAWSREATMRVNVVIEDGDPTPAIEAAVAAYIRAFRDPAEVVREVASDIIIAPGADA